MKNLIIITAILIFVSGCSKNQDKKTEDSKAPSQQNSTTKTDNGNKSSGQTDEKAVELSKAADDAIAKYAGDKSDATKKEVIDKCLAAANYVEFESNLPAKEKYRPALRYYRKVLEFDPNNEAAMKNKDQIEAIYKQMGLPIPQ